MPSRIHQHRSDRLAKLEHLLFRSETGLRAVELAAHCDVDRRTIYRDLALMEMIGLPLYQHEGRFWLDREKYQAAVRFTFDERAALLLAVMQALPYAAEIGPHLHSAVGKLAAVLPLPLARWTPQQRQRQLNSAPSLLTSEIVSILLRAWGDQRPLRIWYRARHNDKIYQRVVEPCALRLTRQGGVVLLARDRRTGRRRTIALRRIQRVQAQPLTAAIPHKIDGKPSSPTGV